MRHLAVLLLLASTVCAADRPARSPAVAVVRAATPGVVLLRIPSPEGRRPRIGAGVVVDATKGLIVTNAHVVGKATEVDVQLHDGTHLAGAVVWSDPSEELAVLKLATRRRLTALPLAKEDAETGESVLVIGHPYGHGYTVTRGIVSAVDREIVLPSGEVLGGLLQTDAAINPGNSGGPLLNSAGEVVGIAVAVRDGARGIGFAVSAGAVRRALARHGAQWVADRE